LKNKLNTQLDKNKTNLFLIACLISTLGSSLSNLVLAYRFLLETNNGAEYSIVIYSALIATVIAGPWGGHYIDKTINSHKFLIPINIFLGIIQIFLAYTYSLFYAFALIFFSTVLNNIAQSIIFKLLPSILENKRLIKVNAYLQEISTIGFIFGPVVAPLLKVVFKEDSFLFLIDATSFFITATIFSLFVNKIHYPMESRPSKKYNSDSNIMSSYKSFFSDKEMRRYLIGFLLYMMAFSPMAFSLALVAKNTSNNIPTYYSLPILSMFLGRLLSTRFIVRRIEFNDLLKTLTNSLFLSGLIIFPLSMISHLSAICFFEFFLGIVISIVNFSERTYSQTAFQKDILGKLSTTKQLVSVVSKGISVALITMLVSNGRLSYTTPLLSFFFVFSGLYFNMKYRFRANLAETT
jgi:hypothetical protein